MHKLKVARISLFMAVLMALALFQGYGSPAKAENSRYFPETGHNVSGKFLDYWERNGGLPVYGYPITDAQMEVDPETGKTFLTQWFERNRFELHPENAGTRFEVLLGLLGKDLRRQALAIDPDFQRAGARIDYSKPKEQQWYFSETGHNLSFGFLNYWLENGGLERFGYPISELHTEIDPETGNPYQTQWFERARFEYHPDNQPPYDILLGLLGNQIKAPKSRADFQWKIGGGYDRFFRLTGIAVDGQDNVYALDTLNQRVLKYDNNGTILAQWSNKANPEGQFSVEKWQTIFTVDKQGNVYLSDNTRTVYKFDKDGRFLTKWGGVGNGDGQFAAASSRYLTSDNQGNVFVAEDFVAEGGVTRRVQKFDSNGKFLGKWSNWSVRSDKFSTVRAISTDNQGNVYVVGNGYVNTDAGYSVTIATIAKFDNNGTYLTRWESNDAAGWESLTVDRQGNVYLGLNYGTAVSNIKKYSNDGQLLATWGRNGTDEGRYAFINGLATDSQGNLFTAEEYIDRIQKFDPNGNLVTRWGKSFNGPGQFPPDPVAGPTDVAVNRQGNFYVADPGNYRIQKFSGATGAFQLQFGSKGTGDGQFGADPYSASTTLKLAIDGLGYVYVVDNANYRIQKFDSNGQFILKWGGPGTGDGQFDNTRFPGGPQGIAVDSKGNVYVADNGNSRVQKFDSNGKFLMKWGSVGGGNGQFAYPWGIAVDSQDNVYVADDLRIQKFDSNGNYILHFGNRGLALATDAQNNVYVAGTPNNRIWKFDSNGNFLFDWGGLGTGDGQFAPYLTGIASDKAGLFYVADTRNNRIQQFRLR